MRSLADLSRRKRMKAEIRLVALESDLSRRNQMKAEGRREKPWFRISAEPPTQHAVFEEEWIKQGGPVKSWLPK